MVGPDVYEADVCPGWLVRQPMVVDGGRAWQALRNRALPLYDPFELNVTWEMAEVAEGAFSQYELHKQRELARRLPR